MNDDIRERLRSARLVWAMACHCECEACNTLFSELQRIVGDAPKPAVDSSAQPGEERG